MFALTKKFARVRDTHTHTHTRSLTHSLSLTHTHTHTYTHPLTRSLTRSLTRWFTESSTLLLEFLDVFRDAAPRDRVALLRCVAWWILHYAQCTRSAGAELAQLVVEAEAADLPVEPECMDVLREGFPPDPPLALPGAGSDAPQAIALFPSERKRKSMSDIGWFLSLEPVDVATQLTVLDASLLSKIGPDEFRVQTRYSTARVLWWRSGRFFLARAFVFFVP